MEPFSFNQVVIDPVALRTNFRLLQKRVGQDVQLLAMVKADAYGHGMVEAARIFAHCGCTLFGVAELTEAVRLRQAGITGQILVMLGFSHDQAELFCRYDLSPVVYDSTSIEQLALVAHKHKCRLNVHVKIDCGMGRLGFGPDEVEAVLAQLDGIDSLVVDGVMTHFPKADEPTSTHTEESFALYRAALTRSKGKFKRCHVANSGALLNFPMTHCDIARPGIALYGYYPDGAAGRTRETAELLVPAMRFTTRVVQLKEMAADRGVSYGHTFKTGRPTRLAVLPVGYEDGYFRALSNCGSVLIRGRRAPVVGRICMNLCMVDVTDIDDVQQGDEVVLLGSQGKEEITADEIAALVGTISYEVLCMFGNNNERNYLTEDL